jgi:hypothetical protein
MKRIGISISQTRLSAFAWEQSPFSGRPLCACSVPCAEPYGSPEDVRFLGEELRSRLGSNALPPAVLSIPPSLTWLRMLDLPVPDLRNARIIHAAELEGSLPVDDEEAVSDLLQVAGGEPPDGRFLAIAVRRSVLDRFTAVFRDSGFLVERVVADPVSLLCAASSLGFPARGTIVSFESDVILLSVASRAIRKLRQLPQSILSPPDRFLREVEEFLGDGEPLFAAAEAPGSDLPLPGPEPARLRPPGDHHGASLVAFGAARVPFSPAVAHGFSFTRGERSRDEEGARPFRRKVAAISVAAALLSCIVALELARWSSSRQLASVRSRLRTEFAAAVPEARVVVRETVQLREKIAALERQRAELGHDLPPVTPLLGTVSTALPQGKSLSVREISIDGARVRVAGESATGSGAVEGYRGALAAALGSGYSVTVQESRGSARGESVAFTILIEPGGRRRAS